MKSKTFRSEPRQQVCRQLRILGLLIGALLLKGCGENHLQYLPADKSGWLRCSSESGGFSVTFPGRPKVTVTEKLVAKSVRVQVHGFMVEPDKSAAFGVAYNDFPEFILKAPTQELFDGGQKSLLGKSGRLVSASDGVFDNYPMRQVRFERPDLGYEIESRMILVKGRLYQLVFTAKPSKENSVNGKYFFDSFKLKNK
jgi:hypothetical protein